MTIKVVERCTEPVEV